MNKYFLTYEGEIVMRALDYRGKPRDDADDWKRGSDLERSRGQRVRYSIWMKQLEGKAVLLFYCPVGICPLDCFGRMIDLVRVDIPSMRPWRVYCCTPVSRSCVTAYEIVYHCIGDEYFADSIAPVRMADFFRLVGYEHQTQKDGEPRERRDSA